MTRKIHKYLLTKTTGRQLVDMRQNARILAFAAQAPLAAGMFSASGLGAERLVIWVEENPEALPVRHALWLAFTGDDAPEGTYIGTTSTLESNGMQLVWHLYDEDADV